MEWTKYYQGHTLTPEQAVGLIHDGDRVVFGHAVGEPIIFQRTMAEMADQFHDVEVAHMVYLGSGEYLQPGMESHFRHNALFVGGPARKAKTAGYEELSGIEQITGKLSAYRNIPEENFEEICIKNRIIDSISTIYWWKKALVLL